MWSLARSVSKSLVPDHPVSGVVLLEASKGGMKVGRIKDPLYQDPNLGLPHLPSSYLLRPLILEMKNHAIVEAISLDQAKRSQAVGFGAKSRKPKSPKLQTLSPEP